MKINLEADEKHRLTKVLLGCLSITDQDRRQSVINDLPPIIRDSIHNNSTTHVQVLQLINTCTNYSEGIPQLLKILELYEGPSIPMGEVLVTWSDILVHRVKIALQQQQWSLVIEWGRELQTFAFAHDMFAQHLNEKTFEAKEAINTAEEKLKTTPLNPPTIIDPLPKIFVNPSSQSSPWGWPGFGVIIGGLLLIGIGVMINQWKLSVVANIVASPTISITFPTSTPMPSISAPISPTASTTQIQSTTPPIRPNSIITSTMIFIPAGEFTMGSNQEEVDAAMEKCNSDCKKEDFEAEMPKHKVYLGDYFIDKYEVTNAEYAKCLESDVCGLPKCDEYTMKDKANYPVVCVNWKQAKIYCEFVGKRLPTEAEWEKAARGTDKRIWPWGNNQPNDKLLNYNDSMLGTTMEVGSYIDGASPYGVMDMAGNVYEWVSSNYKPYPYKADDGREGVSKAGFKILRGGGWGSFKGNVRIARRTKSGIDHEGDTIGIRCASSIR